ncbi:MAG TPA: hypothetical protein VJS45_14210 [Acidimicrobiia bacterium]|nr:hypothetical protein [Acidimicrobiia bacterium]
MQGHGSDGTRCRSSSGRSRGSGRRRGRNRSRRSRNESRGSRKRRRRRRRRRRLDRKRQWRLRRDELRSSLEHDCRLWVFGRVGIVGRRRNCSGDEDE